MSTESKQNVINSKNIDEQHKILVQQKKDLLQLRNQFNKEIKTLEKELNSIVAIKGLAKEQMEKKKEIVHKLRVDTAALKKSRDELLNTKNDVRTHLNTEKGEITEDLKHVLDMTIKQRLTEGKKMVNEFKSQYKPSYFSRLYKSITGTRSRRIVNNTNNKTKRNENAIVSKGNKFIPSNSRIISRPASAPTRLIKATITRFMNNHPTSILKSRTSQSRTKKNSPWYTNGL